MIKEFQIVKMKNYDNRNWILLNVTMEKILKIKIALVKFYQ